MKPVSRRICCRVLVAETLVTLGIMPMEVMFVNCVSRLARLVRLLRRLARPVLRTIT